MEYENLPRSGIPSEGLGVDDRAVFERVWRRVMPEDRPDCPFVLDGEQTQQSEEEAAVPAAPQQTGLPAPVHSAAEAQSLRVVEEQDGPCLGAASAVHGAQLQGFIENELADWKLYQALARRAGGSSSRVLSAIAADERRHAKRLSTAYFLISGVRYWPVERAATPVRGTFAGMLRQRFGDEQRGTAAYQAAAEETADSCLRELYMELAGDEDAHAWLIRGILEQM